MSKGECAESPKKDGFEKYEIEEAVRTLIRAEEIKQNKKLRPVVMKELDRQLSAMKKIRDA